MSFDVEGAAARTAELERLLAIEQAKNSVLLEKLLEMEDKDADRELEGFSDVVPNDSRDYWREQYLENRERTIAELTRIRARIAEAGKQAGKADGVPAPSPVPAAGPATLHNRENAAKAVERRGDGAAGVMVAPREDRAAKVRNRAQKIAGEERVSYTEAWRRAEREFPE